MTYRQAIEAFRTHCSFVSPADREAILGGTLDALLRTRRPDGSDAHERARASGSPATAATQARCLTDAVRARVEAARHARGR